MYVYLHVLAQITNFLKVPTLGGIRNCVPSHLITCHLPPDIFSFSTNSKNKLWLKLCQAQVQLKLKQFSSKLKMKIPQVQLKQKWKLKLKQPLTKLKFKRRVHYFLRGGWLGGEFLDSEHYDNENDSAPKIILIICHYLLLPLTENESPFADFRVKNYIWRMRHILHTIKLLLMREHRF